MGPSSVLEWQTMEMHTSRHGRRCEGQPVETHSPSNGISAGHGRQLMISKPHKLKLLSLQFAAVHLPAVASMQSAWDAQFWASLQENILHQRNILQCYILQACGRWRLSSTVRQLAAVNDHEPMGSYARYTHHTLGQDNTKAGNPQAKDCSNSRTSSAQARRNAKKRRSIRHPRLHPNLYPP